MAFADKRPSLAHHHKYVDIIDNNRPYMWRHRVHIRAEGGSVVTLTTWVIGVTEPRARDRHPSPHSTTAAARSLPFYFKWFNLI